VLLIVGVKAPILQMAPLFLYLIGIIVFIIVAKPFKTKKEMFITLVNNILFVVALGFFALLLLLQDVLDEKAKFIYLGYPIVLTLLVIISLNLLIGFWDTGWTIKNVFKIYRK